MTKLFGAILLIGLAAPAHAHLSPEEHGSFLAGFTHPWFGVDHILAMVAVGLWAASMAGKALWQLPLSFVAAMVLGFGLALGGVPLPMVEPAILASVIVLGLILATTLRLPLAACLAICAGFGLFHGHAHGGELGSAGALGYGIGFAVATAALHAGGIALGMALSKQLKSAQGSQILGGLTALGGAWLAFA